MRATTVPGTGHRVRRPASPGPWPPRARPRPGGTAPGSRRRWAGGRLQVMLGGDDERLVVEGLGEAGLAAGAPLDGQGLVVEALVPPPGRSTTRSRPPRPGPWPLRGRRPPRRHGQGLVQPAAALGQVPALLPEPPQGPGGRLGGAGLATVDGPAEGRARLACSCSQRSSQTPWSSAMRWGSASMARRRKCSAWRRWTGSRSPEARAAPARTPGSSPASRTATAAWAARSGGSATCPPARSARRGRPGPVLRVAHRLGRCERPAAGEHRQPGNRRRSTGSSRS